MSKENAMRFFKLVEENHELKEKYLTVIIKYFRQKLSQEEQDKIFVGEILPLAREAGFEFTLDELKELETSSQSAQLSDEELEKVVAGADGAYSVDMWCDVADNSTMEKSLLAGIGNYDGMYKCPKYEVDKNYRYSYNCRTCKNFNFRAWGKIRDY
ncbi:MAG: hypothetical protein CVU90_13180 [Firmicutes bacterium HGW-Firmicutes-15]|nr:MAG: hypothetical protein CVU90_13180 [Firmicutes bacterium HGW-Firmicutes-15]